MSYVCHCWDVGRQRIEFCNLCAWWLGGKHSKDAIHPPGASVVSAKIVRHWFGNFAPFFKIASPRTHTFSVLHSPLFFFASHSFVSV